MAQLIKGNWRIEILESKFAAKRPNPALLFSITEEQAQLINPLTLTGLLFACATELTEAFSMMYPDQPFHVSVDDGFAVLDGRVLGVVRITWPPDIILAEHDGSLVSAAVSILSRQLEHMHETQHHHTIVSAASREEVQQLWSDPEFSLAVSIRPQNPVLVRREPELTINTPPTKGVN